MLGPEKIELGATKKTHVLRTAAANRSERPSLLAEDFEALSSNGNPQSRGHPMGESLDK